MGTGDILLGAGGGGGNLAMDWHPIQGGVAILLGMLHTKETWISNLIPRVSHLPAQAREERPWLGLVTCYLDN